MAKDTTVLQEGRRVDIGSLRLIISNLIATGGFSFVYLARCVDSSKFYALKHIITLDNERISLVKKEIHVLTCFKGHPNIVELHGHTVVNDGGKTEVFIAMEHCDRSLVDVIESRGLQFYAESELLGIFLDICNALCAMHAQTPPFAHRDIKAENVLLGSDGKWKLCDFGSTSTRHKKYVTVEEMAFEEDVIRKETTPSYRAPEMWDLYSRNLISEKVDVWAMGCLLFRLAFFKPCFDGESKLQILNCNYRVPAGHRYSKRLLDFIHVMLIVDPEQRPTMKQVWQIASSLLPVGLQRSAPTMWLAPTSTSTPAQTLRTAMDPTRPPQHSDAHGSFWSSGDATEAGSEQAQGSHGMNGAPDSSAGGGRQQSNGSRQSGPATERASRGAKGSFWNTPYASQMAESSEAQPRRAPAPLASSRPARQRSASPKRDLLL